MWKYLLVLMLIVSSSLFGQKKKSPRLEASGTIDGVRVEVAYGAPSVKGRTIFGDLVPYNKVWRTGANENSIITLSQDLIVGGERLAAGTYGLFTTPTAEGWKIHFNSESDNWGAYSYSKSKDVLVVSVDIVALDKLVEQLSMRFTEESLIIEWEKTSVVIPLTKP